MYILMFNFEPLISLRALPPDKVQETTILLTDLWCFDVITMQILSITINRCINNITTILEVVNKITVNTWQLHTIKIHLQVHKKIPFCPSPKWNHHSTYIYWTLIYRETFNYNNNHKTNSFVLVYCSNAIQPL